VAVVYSTQLVSAGDSTGEHLFPVPAGVIWVVRSVSCYAAPLSPSQVLTVFCVSGGTIFGTVLEGPQWDGTDCRQVVPEGDQLGIYSDDVADFLISGYVLTLP
jgi:hypothetical protein